MNHYYQIRMHRAFMKLIWWNILSFLLYRHDNHIKSEPDFVLFCDVIVRMIRSYNIGYIPVYNRMFTLDCL